MPLVLSELTSKDCLNQMVEKWYSFRRLYLVTTHNGAIQRGV